MGKVLIQVGASEEARAAVQAGVPSGRSLVLPRSNVPEDVKPAKEQKPAAEGGVGAEAQAESKPEVSLPIPFHVTLATISLNMHKPATAEACGHVSEDADKQQCVRKMHSKQDSFEACPLPGLEERMIMSIALCTGGAEHRAGARDGDPGALHSARRPRVYHLRRSRRLRPRARCLAGRPRRDQARPDLQAVSVPSCYAPHAGHLCPCHAQRLQIFDAPCHG